MTVHLHAKVFQHGNAFLEPALGLRVGLLSRRYAAQDPARDADLTLGDGSHVILEEELDRLSMDEEIETELEAIKASTVANMEKRVEALETIIDDSEKGGTHHEQL